VTGAPGRLHVVVDAANVIGSRPDGWWRDRAGAARRLLDRLVAALREDPATLAAALGAAGAEPRVIVVLEGKARDAVPPDRAGDVPLTVVLAPGTGDDTIVEAARRTAPPVLVVTADRGLAARVRAAGAEVTGPGALLNALDQDTP
jgi:hypothetical protein